MAIRALKIDVATGDLVSVAGRLQMVEGREAIAQAVRSRLRLIKGEWAFDVGAGVDYFGKILIKNPRRGEIQTELSNAILGVLGVVSLNSITFDHDTRTRTLSVTFEATDDEGLLISDTVEV
jgi:hypothetical protein